MPQMQISTCSSNSLRISVTDARKLSLPAKNRSRKRIFSYAQFRKVTDLSKKEADSWVSRGIVLAELSGDGRRRIYGYSSLMEGNIAKQVAEIRITRVASAHDGGLP